MPQILDRAGTRAKNDARGRVTGAVGGLTRRRTILEIPPIWVDEITQNGLTKSQGSENNPPMVSTAGVNLGAVGRLLALAIVVATAVACSYVPLLPSRSDRAPQPPPVRLP